MPIKLVEIYFNVQRCIVSAEFAFAKYNWKTKHTKKERRKKKKRKKKREKKKMKQRRERGEKKKK